MSDKKNNIFLYTPGGYGPYSRIRFFADRIKGDSNAGNDEWIDAAHDYVDEKQHDIDYGLYFMTREDVEKLIVSLKALLDE
jgi:hypothetical protein